MLNIRAYEEKDLDIAIGLIRLNTPKFFAKHEEQDFYDFLKNNIELYYVYAIEKKIISSTN